jgi:hypothetical protein
MEGDIPAKLKKRLQLFRLFHPLDRKEERRWGKILEKDIKQLSGQLEKIAVSMEYTQEIIEDQFILWRDNEDSRAECLFCKVEDATDLAHIQGIFRLIGEYHPSVTYGFIRQTKDGDGIFDVFRFSRFSYMEHCNRIRSAKYVPHRRRQSSPK